MRESEDLDGGRTVLEYLDSFIEAHNKGNGAASWGRVPCCGSSRSLYCPECFRLLVPESQWPRAIRDGGLDLPFELCVILSDRRRKATGIQALSILTAVGSEDRGERRERHHKLIDIERGEEVPCLEDKIDETFLLFPSPGESIPLESVASKVSRLVVLDCTWKKVSSKFHPELSKLTKVHLTESYSPKESHIWRYHSEGSGMLSTIEAVYFAALEVTDSKMDGKIDLIHLLWLFALQRAATCNAAQREGRLEPFSEAGKEWKRLQRRNIGTPKHEQDILIGRILKERAKKERLKLQQA